MQALLSLQLDGVCVSDVRNIFIFLCFCNFTQVEKWLLELEKAMKASVHHSVSVSYDDYLQQPREKWVIAWPGQAVSNKLLKNVINKPTFLLKLYHANVNVVENK